MQKWRELLTPTTKGAGGAAEGFLQPKVPLTRTTKAATFPPSFLRVALRCQTAGFSAASDAAKVSILIGLLKFLMTGFAVFKVDDLSGITIALLLLPVYYKILSGFPYVAVGALLLYVGAYQVLFGPISWLMVSEIFPLRTRGRGISLAVLTNSGSESVGDICLLTLAGVLWAGQHLLSTAISVLALVFVILNVPEIKGLSLEDIESKILK